MASFFFTKDFTEFFFSTFVARRFVTSFNKTAHNNSRRTLVVKCFTCGDNVWFRFIKYFWYRICVNVFCRIILVKSFVANFIFFSGFELEYS